MKVRVIILGAIFAFCSSTSFAGSPVEIASTPNLFASIGKSSAEISNKVQAAFKQLFYGSDTFERIYYENPDDTAFIYDMGHGDVRSEGMSYGMMLCVQLDHQKEFNKLWKWAKTNMQQDGPFFKNYFAWQVNSNGTPISYVAAPDGEEYFTTALLFAAARWGNGEGIFNYEAEADKILDAMLHQRDDKVGYNMFSKKEHIVIFTPDQNGIYFTDPSYHLPAFYEIWALKAKKDNEIWKAAAEASRAYFTNVCHPVTGLTPDYSFFNGTPHPNNPAFRYDSHRVIMNMALDYAWWKKDTNEVMLVNRIQKFFKSKGMNGYNSGYYDQYSLDGNDLAQNHAPGLVAMNAAGSMAADNPDKLEFVKALWEMPIPTGQWRYYSGCLYLFGLIQCSGQYKAW